MLIAITGGAGFIGANLVRRMAVTEAVSEVRVVDDLSTGRVENLAGMRVVQYRGSILDPQVLDAAFQGVDAVVHLAALPSVPRSLSDPIASHHANATGTLQVLEAARRAGGVYVTAASSSSVYGAEARMPKVESMRAAPLSPYAVSKLATEAYLGAYYHSFGLPVLAFRLFNVFGPMQAARHPYAAVIPKFIDAALGEGPLLIYGDGSQTRDFTYVDNVCRVLTEAVLNRRVSPDPVNLAFGGRVSLMSVVAMLERILGRTLPVTHSPPRAADVPHSQADTQRLRMLFPGVTPVDVEEGLSRTVEWAQSQAAGQRPGGGSV